MRQAGSFARERIKNIIQQDIPKREKILEKVATYEQARNKALEIIGDVDRHSYEPVIGKQGVCKGKITGLSWKDGEVVLRLDHDLVKGPHINVNDYRTGKGLKGVSKAIPFEGDVMTVESILKHLNSDANLATSRAVFVRNGKLEYFNTQISKEIYKKIYD